MPHIQTENWTPSPDNPGRQIYAGQRTAKEVFDDLQTHLRSIGYLPDEYFLFDCSRKWGGGRTFPEDGWLTSQVNFGGNEGIYLDVTLAYYENGMYKTEPFATGKTLGESGNDLDRMNLVASSITKAFHDEGVHARFIMVGGGTPAPEGITANLSPEERRVAVDGLMQLRETLVPEDQDYALVDQLLNRIGGDDFRQDFQHNQSKIAFGMNMQG